MNNRMINNKFKNLFFYLFVMLSIFSIACFFMVNSLIATLFIFFISSFLFHALLLRFRKYDSLWKATDYLFELVAILSIIAAVIGLNEASRQRYLQEQFAKRKLAQVEFIYAAESVITNDCDPLQSRADVWEVSPEPNEGECDRIKHMLPQMRFDFGRETGPENMTSDIIWAYNFEYKDQSLEGTWKYFQDKAEEFIEISKENEYAINQRDAARDKKDFDFSKIESIFYWHHILAFLLALKISRISMDVFKK